MPINKPAAFPSPGPIPSQREDLRRTRLEACLRFSMVFCWFHLPVSIGGFGGSSNLIALLEHSSEAVMSWWWVPILSLIGSIVRTDRSWSGIALAVMSVVGVIFASVAEPLNSVRFEATVFWSLAIVASLVLTVRRARADKRSRDEEAESWAEPRRALYDYVPYPRDGFFKRVRRR